LYLLSLSDCSYQLITVLNDYEIQYFQQNLMIIDRMIQIDEIDALEKIRNVQLFILDLDGTVYLENELIPGAFEFIENLAGRGISCLFLTNNSSQGTAEYVRKLKSLGITAAENCILTSGQATGIYLAQSSGVSKVFVVGTDALKHELAMQGHCICDDRLERVDCVVAGFDTELTYQKVIAACRYIENGADFIATNPDLVCPVKGKRYIPDCGSIYKLIENATGRKPFVIGKPSSIMSNIISSRFHISFDQMAVIGDRLYTDIAFGKNASIYSVCVLTGETSAGDILVSPWKPDLVISSISFLNNAFIK